MISLLSGLFFAGVLLSALKSNPLRALALAFFLGFVLDIFLAQTLGFSSILFLLTSGIVLVLKQRFSFSNPLAVFFLTFFLYFPFRLAAGRSFKVLEVLFLSLAVAIFSFPKKEKISL
ncbi:MAG: hypothetical protein ACOZBZ_02995 [Patescibacteria group bacterium]